MSGHRIDTHQHFLPAEWLRWLGESGYQWTRAIPDWSPEWALDAMDQLGIATGVLSISRPGVHLGDDTSARGAARMVNEIAADLGRTHPGRFGSFASLPVPDIDGAIAEAEHSIKVLKADGVVLLTNIDGDYLGHPKFDPLMEALNELEATVFVHPTKLPGAEVDGLPAYLADFLLDTTRAGINLVRQAVPTRFPQLKFILAHGGGFLPYCAHRVAQRLPTINPELGTADDVLAQFRAFYFDTALTASVTSMPSLLALAAPGRVLYGSDFPYPPLKISRHFTDELDAYPLDEATRASINGEAARPLLSGLRARAAQPS